MKEYKLYNYSSKWDDRIENELNKLALEGWTVKCVFEHLFKLLLEREKSEESK